MNARHPRISVIVRCSKHGTYHPKSAGCGTCATHARALALADKAILRARRSAALARAEVRRLDEIAEGFFHVMTMATMLAVLVACGTAPQEEEIAVPGSDRVVMNGSPTFAESYLDAIIDQQTSQLPELSTSWLTFIIVDTEESAFARCGFGHWSCTSPGGVIIAPWDLTPSNWPASIETVQMNVRGLSHELCHAFYFQDGGDGDPNHAHADCFDDQDGVVAHVTEWVIYLHGQDALAAVGS